MLAPEALDLVVLDLVVLDWESDWDWEEWGQENW